MAYAPPSYQAAAYRQLWIIIAPFVQSDDLYSACLVCRQWHHIFAPYLWGNPASRFGLDYDYDTVYLSLTRFKRLLLRARLDVRSLAHTLHIPPAQAEFYDGPQAGWLRDILDRLPSLQSLIASRLSFFDHRALQAVHQGYGESVANPRTYPLRLLIATGCENTTAAGLGAALRHFPDLIYLDLSSTQGVRNQHLLQQIGSLWDLKILKLRRCGLRDEDVDSLSFSNRLLSLDLSHNNLTERGISTLLKTIPPANYGPPSPFARRYSGVPLPKKVLADGLEKYVARHLTNGSDGYLRIEEGLPSSFTQLYLMGNYITVDALSRMLCHFNLDYLDCGSLSLSHTTGELLTPRSPVAESRRLSHTAAEVPRLSPASFTQSFRTLRSLRVHHSVITAYPFSGIELSTSEQYSELHSEDLRFELDSAEVFRPGTLFELSDTSVGNTPEPPESLEPTTQTHPTFESPDDIGTALDPISPIEIIQSRANRPAMAGNSYNIPRKAVAPRVSVSHPASQGPGGHVSSSSTSVPEGPAKFRYKYSAGEEEPWREALCHPPKATSISELLDEIAQRRHRIAARERHPGRLRPSMLPNLKTLTLTEVPTKTRRRDVTDSISLFIQECAEEEEIARLEEQSKQQGVNQPPSWDLYPIGTLKLQRLVLEMTSAPDPFEPLQSQRSPRPKRGSFTKSSTADPDSEMFMEATETDFSFFDEDDGGLLVRKGRIDTPVSFDDGMMFESGDQRLIDVVSELSSFRREKKMKHEAALKLDTRGLEAALLGHWRGEIKVIKEFAT